MKTLPFLKLFAEFFLAIFLFLVIGIPAFALGGDGASSNIQLLDTNANGKIDRITFDIANPNGETWQLAGAAPHGLSVTQGGNDIGISSVSLTTLATANPVGIQIDLDEGDADLVVDTNGVTTNAVELLYTQQTGDNACTVCIQDSTDEELNTIASGDTGATDTENDAAAPQITLFTYQDMDADAKIERFFLSFSETLDPASVLSANDLLLTNVGDFTGAAFGADMTDLLTSAGSTVTVVLGTEATALDTAENSGNIAISSQNAFSLTDGTNVNVTLGNQSQASFGDGAAPAPISAQYQDNNEDGTVDRIALTFSETIGVYTHDNAAWTFPENTALNLAVTTLLNTAGAIVTLGVNADAGETSTTPTPTVVFTDTATSVLTDGTNTQVGPTAAVNVADGAAPVINTFTYQDNDSDGRIDRFLLSFSETVDAASVLSANDLVLTNVGDFTGAAFGADATDLITSSGAQTTVVLGTEATAVDTSEDSGNIAISSQNAFSLSDGTNVNSTLGAQSQATFAGDTTPLVTIVTPAAGTYSVDSLDLNVTTSEPANCTYDYGNGTKIAMTTTGGTNHTETITVAEGNYTLQFDCTNAGAATGTANVAFTISGGSSGGGGGGGGGGSRRRVTDAQSNTDSADQETTNTEGTTETGGAEGGSSENADIRDPERLVNRAEAAKWYVTEMLGLTVSDIQMCDGEIFPDVFWQEWYGPYICELKRRGIVNGRGDGLFHPEEYVNAAEMYKVFFADWSEKIVTTPVPTQCSFSGENAWYEPYFISAINTLLPNDPCEPSRFIRRNEFYATLQLFVQNFRK